MDSPKTLQPALGLSTRYGMGTEEFSSLMKWRVLEVLIVASRYDTFALEANSLSRAALKHAIELRAAGKTPLGRPLSYPLMGPRAGSPGNLPEQSEDAVFEILEGDLPCSA